MIERPGRPEALTSESSPTTLEGGFPLAAADRTGKSPAFQFYPKDFLSDANVMAMSLTELGAYWKLTCICWNEGSLPADTKSLARLLGIPQGHASKLWPSIEPCFREKDGRLVHPRLDGERKKQAEYRRKQAENGKKGGRPFGKAVGFSGVTQHEAKESSSSAISVLRTAEEKRETPPARQTPIIARRRPGAAFEGARGLYVVESQHQQFVGLRNHPGAERELLAWYAGVCEDWAYGSHASSTPNPDMFKFWQERFVEHWPPTAAAKVDEKVPEWLRRARASQAAS